MFRRVRDDVVAATNPVQYPHVYGTLGGKEFYLLSPMAAPAPVVTAVRPSEAAEAWATAKDSTSIAVLEAFRRQYGASNAFYDRLAEARIEELKKQQTAVIVPPEPKPEPPKAVIGPNGKPLLSLRPPARLLTVAEERALKPGDSFRECEECPEMVVVPAGSFTMGSPPNEEGREPGSEGPQHRVTIARPFAARQSR